jgi:DNA modification methylase
MVELNTILQGHCLAVLKTLPDESVNTVITSPPYWGLRDYGVEEQIGLEKTPEKYIENMVLVFREIRRVLRNDGTVWLNLGDSYWANRSTNGLEYVGNKGKNKDYMLRAGSKSHNFLKPKDLVGIPWRVAFALQEDGWYLRADIIWNKTKCMPEAVKDRPTKSHEYIFLLSKSEKYYYDHEAIKEPTAISTKERFKQDINQQNGSTRANAGAKNNGNMKAVGDGLTRNKRSVWSVSTKPFKEAHFATYPPDLIEPCVLAGSPIDGIVLDPFFGSGTTGFVAVKHNRNFIGIEINQEYIKIAEKRLSEVQLELINEL